MKVLGSIQLYREFIRLSYRFPVESIRQKIRLNTKEMWQLNQHETNKININNSITKARNIYTLLQKLVNSNSAAMIFSNDLHKKKHNKK
ncbi:hypothetical protein PPL_02182 [Heterostelium album PN500]|uniref:Complex 1 LYR protein domain-containing protein n=1 Tax=Heterostelium pallidum (strain ATCC 26659 / Pp 5 / PN500) TaxID=670386 RepID=D3B1K8_HETP5|nr:hypothetical protein PPL_02182 [Heterostelium album PN500]EFA85182.1 hypothetical protein PPL_02182 [Heterostelium album PN500]|eukprot:XP_020437291.1 hypothetical protein PPL_02182 [Heterostelium album PN500]